MIGTGTPSPTGTGSLAHTLSSSRAGLFAGIAALFNAAGAALIAAAARRRGRSSHR
ncbi:hypothetical protein V2S66_33180 [Streptomyces sp. V4-01]|uniref:Uncharacterized protein n=1 Tax=Actinacidiphila polyblastidii TaxID=3110430 RepID=A0ABU7PM81_9ACTN|nr:hypothetical protein [Streptomyces sp. V4-01]